MLGKAQYGSQSRAQRNYEEEWGLRILRVYHRTKDNPPFSS